MPQLKASFMHYVSVSPPGSRQLNVALLHDVSFLDMSMLGVSLIWLFLVRLLVSGRPWLGAVGEWPPDRFN